MTHTQTGSRGQRAAADMSLWLLQILLSALFLFAGGFKLAMPVEALAGQIGLPAGFMQFIGSAEIVGGLGLLLPGLARIHRELTVLAAVGLVIIMIGAIVLSVLRVSAAAAIPPLVTGVLLTVVARGRRHWGPRTA